MKTGIVCFAVAAACALPLGALTLEEGFKAPPASAKPHTWYHMIATSRRSPRPASAASRCSTPDAPSRPAR